MNGAVRLMVLSGGLFALGQAALAANKSSEANPYVAIWERNVFGLKAPPPPPPPPPPAPPPSNIKLSGITAFLRTKKAMLIYSEGTAKPEYLNLAVGERYGALEVMDIDEKNGVVQVKNAGQEVLLNFEKPPPGPAAPGQPGAPPAPGASGVPSIPSIIRPGTGTSPGSGVILPNQPGRQTMPSAPGGGPQIPTRAIRTTPGASIQQQYGPPVSAEAASRDPDVATILFLGNQINNQKAIDNKELPPAIPLHMVDPSLADPAPGPPSLPGR